MPQRWPEIQSPRLEALSRSTAQSMRSLAAALKATFYEVILAPGFDAEARAALGAKKNLRIVETCAPQILCPTEPFRSARFRVRCCPTARCVSGRLVSLAGGERASTHSGQSWPTCVSPGGLYGM